MIWYAVYDNTSGALFSVSTVLGPLPSNLSAKSFDVPAQPDPRAWHTANLDFSVVIPTVYTWTTLEFMRRFTSAERIAIRNKAQTDSNVDDFMDLMRRAPAIHSNDADVNSGLNYFVSLGLITSARKSVILGA